MGEATAMPKAATKNPVNATKLQLHVSHRADIAPADRKALVDYTEKKLKRLLKRVFSAEKRAQIADLLEKYVAGKAAVGWLGNTPHFTELRNDK